MKPVYVFCESYVKLRNTLFVLEQNYRVDRASVVVLRNNQDLLRLFRMLKDSRYGDLLEIIHLSHLQRDNTIGVKWIDAVSDLLAERKYLRALFAEHFEGVEDTTVYFFCRWFNPYTFYMLKRLKQDNRLIYMYPKEYEEVDITEVHPDGFRTWARKLRLKCLYGSGITLAEIPTHQFAYIEDGFLDTVDKHIPRSERNRLMREFSLSGIIEHLDYDVVFYDTLDQYLKKYVDDLEGYREVVTHVFEVLLKYYDRSRIGIKYHPGGEPPMDMSEYGEVVPRFLPGELLNKEGTILLGIASTCIGNANAGYPVSLIELFDYRDEATESALKAVFVDRSTSNVVFPNTLDEFEDIIVSQVGGAAHTVRGSRDAVR